jgi:hypothetical protein
MEVSLSTRSLAMAKKPQPKKVKTAARRSPKLTAAKKSTRGGRVSNEKLLQDVLNGKYTIGGAID